MAKKFTVFVTGTDTGVGKTVVTAALAMALRRSGHAVGVMKPVETGVVKGRWSDADRLRQAAQVFDPIDLVRPYSFRLPVAPLDAAKAERRTIRLSAILQAYRTLRLLHDFVLVEGVGGVQVPLTPTASVLDLIASMKVPALVVGRSGLGGVNHALLTLHALRRHNIAVVALLLNRAMAVKTAAARRQERSTVGLLRAFAGVPVIGPLPYLSGSDAQFARSLSRLAANGEVKKLMKVVSASARESR